MRIKVIIVKIKCYEVTNYFEQWVKSSRKYCMP